MTDEELQRLAMEHIKKLNEEASKDWIVDWMVFGLIGIVMAIGLLTHWLILAWSMNR